VDVHAKLAEIRQAVEQARSMPMSASAVVNRAELLAMIDEVSGAVETAFSDSQRVLAERGVAAIVKGLRAVSDFDYELQMAQMNASLTDVETVFVPTSPEWSFLASSLVKEVATFGGDVSSLVPGFVHERLVARIAENAARG
jgi:pantetheine-phosphate adenylyltransferase